MMKVRRRGLLALLAVLGLLAAACGDDADTADPDSDPGGQTTTTESSNGDAGGDEPDGDDAMEPRHGGTITVGQFSTPAGLDPTSLAGGGTVGGMELMAIYDVLFRYNNDTVSYEPRTAESIEPNDDFTVWTLTLKPDITFTDGTPYDAEAVKFVHDRQVEEGQPSPRGQFTSAVESVEVIDDLTVQYTLRQAWVEFPYVLSGVNGLIYSPDAYEAAGEDFNTDPGDAGAGPFMLGAFSPGESLELERNPDYWNDPLPYLDQMTFTLVAGPDATYEAVRSGTFDAGYVRDPSVVAQAEADGFNMVHMPAVAGNMLNMNSGEVVCEGGEPEEACADVPDGEVGTLPTATADVRVRQAVAHAVDPEVLNERAYNGDAMPDSAPFANFPWDPGVEGPEADPERARELVEEAKADGWDGTIRVLAGNDPVGRDWGQAVAAQLEAVGMDVDLDTSKDIQQIVMEVIVQRDFDITTWAYGLLDEHGANYQQMISNLSCSTRQYGYCNPEMDEAIDLLRLAETDEERTEAYRQISEIWVEDVPAHVITQIPQALIYRDGMHDPVRTAASSVLFDQAWIEE